MHINEPQTKILNIEHLNKQKSINDHIFEKILWWS